MRLARFHHGKAHEGTPTQAGGRGAMVPGLTCVFANLS